MMYVNVNASESTKESLESKSHEKCVSIKNKIAKRKHSDNRRFIPNKSMLCLKKHYLTIKQHLLFKRNEFYTQIP